MPKYKEKVTAMIEHPIPPVFDEHSNILILGSFPSVQSRDTGFFYGHPQNRFWRVLAAVFEDEIPQTIGEKQSFLLRHHVALWDVIASCDIVGSSDSSIRNVRPNDLTSLLEKAPIRHIYVNGQKAHSLYRRYLEPVTGRNSVCLPSTSPANARWGLEKLIAAWKIILDH